MEMFTVETFFVHVIEFSTPTRKWSCRLNKGETHFVFDSSSGKKQ